MAHLATMDKPPRGRLGEEGRRLWAPRAAHATRARGWGDRCHGGAAGRLVRALRFTIADGKIAAIEVNGNPARLDELDVSMVDRKYAVIVS